MSNLEPVNNLEPVSTKGNIDFVYKSYDVLINHFWLSRLSLTDQLKSGNSGQQEEQLIQSVTDNPVILPTHLVDTGLYL